MRTVDIDDLECQLLGVIQCVRNGEEIVVRDHSVLVARILPFHADLDREREARLVASGALKLPDEPMDWDAFFALPTGNVSRETAIQAAIESRGDR